MRAPATLRYLIGPFELIHEQAGPRLLHGAQLGIFLLWLAKLLLDPIWRLAELPRALVKPAGPLQLLPTSLLHHLYSSHGLILLWIFLAAALIVSLLTVLTGRCFALSATVTAVLLTVYSCVIRSFGPSVHTDIVLLLSVYVFAGFACADLPVRIKTSASVPLVTVVTLLCLTYCLVGLNRTFAGGPRVFTGDSMQIWAVDAGLRGYYFNIGIGQHLPQWPFVVVMLQLGLPVITLFEMAAPLCLASPHFRWVFLPVMLSFHLLSLVFMNIFFFDDMLLYLLLIDWSRRFPALRQRNL